MKTKNEDIIKKLFESKCSLSPEERAALNNYEYVNDTFHRQWEEMSEEAVDLVREEKILNEEKEVGIQAYYEESKRAEVSFYKEILL